MDEDTRQDGKPEEEGDEAGWYFDLPRGAWERQEAKNRELRQSVRRNMDTQEPKKDVFGGSTGHDAADEPPPLFRSSANEDEDEDEAIRRRWHFDEPDETTDQDEDEGPVWGNAGHPVDAVPADLPLRFKLRSEREPEEEASPQLKPPPGLFSGEDPEERPALQGVGLGDEPAPEPAATIEEPQAREPEEARPSTPEPAVQPEQSRSRWEEFFGQKAADDSSMLEGMRSWASGSEQPAATPDEERPSLSPADAPADIPAASEGGLLEGMRSWASGSEQPAAAPGEERPSLSPADAPADTPAASEGGLLEGMRSWASSAHEPAAERAARAEQDPPASEELPPLLDADSLPLRRRSQEEDEPPPPPVDEEPKTRWDEMFSAKAGDDAGLLEGMRAWAKTSSTDDEPEAPRRVLEPEDEQDPPDDSLFKPFEWESKDPSDGESGWTPPPPPEEDKKGGLVGRLFGRKKQDEPAGPSAFNANWIEPEEEPAEFPPSMSVSDEPQDDTPGGWLGRSDGAENRFERSSDDDEQPATEFRWTPTIGEDAPSSAPETGQPVDSPRSGDPWTSSPPVETTRFSIDDPWKAQQPEESRSASMPPHADEDELAEWAPDEQPAALTTPGPVPVAEEDPWQQVQAIEDQAEPATPDSLSPPAVASSWGQAQQVEPDPGSDLPSWAQTSEPATEEPEPDPWKSFVARRQELEPDASDAYSTEAPSPPRPAAAQQPSQPSSLWDDTFGSLSDEGREEESFEEGDDVAPASPQDPWAAVAQVSGSNAEPEEPSVFRGTRDVEDALDRYEAERFAEERVVDAPGVPSVDDDPFEGVRPAASSERLEPAYPTAPDHVYYSDEESYSQQPRAAYAADSDDAAVELPEWDDSEISDFTVVRAFERHASAYNDPIAPSEEPVFDDLLGEDADELVAEASEPSTESQYFGRMQGGWAPQRTATGERPPYPWEIDDDQPSREPDRRDDDDTWGYAGGSQPPWHDEAAVGGAAHGAPSVRRRSRSRMLVREIVETGLLALLVFLAVRASFQNFKVDGLSMWPTLEDGEYLIVNKLAYAEVDMERLSNFVPFVEPGEDPNREVFGGPERGDIVVLRDPTEPEIDLIKRIIGLPGETLEIVDGKVYINDHLLMEPYIKQEWHDTKPKISIPEGYYFVMGDNRENSKDSRNGSIGLIPKDLIIGKAMLTYWPRDKFGLAPNEAGDISERDGRPEVTAQTIQD